MQRISTGFNKFDPKTEALPGDYEDPVFQCVFEDTIDSLGRVLWEFFDLM